jgi:hypothetical protein
MRIIMYTKYDISICGLLQVTRVLAWQVKAKRSGVPVLRDIPLVKYLFSTRTEVETNSEMYRTVSGADLVDESLDLDLLGKVPKEKGTKDSADPKDD